MSLPPNQDNPNSGKSKEWEMLEQYQLKVEQSKQLQQQRGGQKQQLQQQNNEQTQEPNPLDTQSYILDSVSEYVNLYAQAIETLAQTTDGQTRTGLRNQCNALSNKIKSLSTNQNLDENSKQIAQKLHRYMQGYDDFMYHGIAVDFDSGESLYRDQTSGKVVVEQNGQILMRPESSEDPQGMRQVMKSIRQNYLGNPSNDNDQEVASTLVSPQGSSEMHKGIRSHMRQLIKQDSEKSHNARTIKIENRIYKLEKGVNNISF